MIVNFNKGLTRRTVNFCEDELNYHINESGCAEEYHDEIIAEIELLYHLRKVDMAERFKQEYLEYLEDNDLKTFKIRFQRFWKTLVA